jgi:Asp-tRNA(Asn)/Glu-tRNA(Gln) amidotransferase A subunit family amidase
MVLLAKTALDDFAAACFGECTIRGTIRNPYDDERMVSGSSGGSAVSVAAGYAPLSLGTDTGGSLRIPAALTGVATLRPTWGLVPNQGVFPVSYSQDVVGPMALSVAGLRMAMNLLTGIPIRIAASNLTGKRFAVVPMETNSLTDMSQRIAASDLTGSRLAGLRTAINSPAGIPIRAATADLIGKRFAVVRGGLAIWGDDPDGPVLRRFNEVCQALSAAGAELIDLDAPPRAYLDESSLITPEFALAARDYFAARPSAPVRDLAELYATGAFSEWAAISLARALDFDPESPAGKKARQQAQSARNRLREYTQNLFATHRLDAVLYPSVQRPASPIGIEQSGVFTRWSENTGFPAVGVPMSPVPPEDGECLLPCSLELLGPEDEDDALLNLAEAVEAVIVGK